MSSKYVLSWDDFSGNRYHVWILRPVTNGTVTYENPVIYKNPRLGINYGDRENGYFPTRYLDIEAKANRPTYDYVLNIAASQRLFESAEARQRQEEDNEKRHHEERRKLGLKQAAAVHMFNMLEVIEAEHEIGNVTLPQIVLEGLQQTLRMARGENN